VLYGSVDSAEEARVPHGVLRVLEWQPRYRRPFGRQTGSFASPPFDGFAVFHYASIFCLPRP